MRSIRSSGLASLGLTVFVLSGLNAPSASAQLDNRFPTKFSVQVNGLVRFARSHQPAEHVLVTLEMSSGGLAAQVTTDPSGKFTFSGLNPMQYIVTVHVQGYVEDRREVNLVTSNSDYVN